jgi:hypothetical protein
MHRNEVATVDIAQATLASAASYLLLGIGFGSAFVAFGVQRLDPAARATSYLFRLLILPGAVALWPLLAAKWLRSGPRGTSV